MDIWRGIKKALPTRKINYLLIPVTVIPMSLEGAKRWNEIYKHVRRQLKRPKIERTNSEGISRSTTTPCYDVRQTNTCLELTYLGIDFYARIQFRTKINIEGLTGRRAFLKFKEMLREDGIDIDDYALPKEQALATKYSIQQPPIRMIDDSMKDLTLNGVNHIDFHSSFPSGLCNTHKEFATTIRRIYERRHEEDGLCKAILNYSIGFMQSIHGCNAKYSKLSKDAIEDNNKRLYELTDRLIMNGRLPLLFNTDGVWYLGKPYHGEGEGDSLGQWHNDHLNCRFRMKSQGCYEFIENGVYYPVARGVAKEITQNWAWGGIYSQENVIIKYAFDEKEGIISHG